MVIGKGRVLTSMFLASFLIAGCATQSDKGAGFDAGGTMESGVATGGSANAFNPYMQKRLPNTRGLSSEGQAIGGQAVAIEAEAAHRPHWKEELYPVVFGSPSAAHEVLVVVDFAKPQSQTVWNEVVAATHNMPPNACKVVVFAKNSENYGTDLMGLAIWHAWARKGQVVPYLTYVFKEWQIAKAKQRKEGKVRVFNNEYDSAIAGGYPIHYNWLMGLKPAISADQELQIARYSYDAGNVNMYQTVQVMRYYGIGSLPAVLVDGKSLPKVSAEAVRRAIGR